MLILRLKSECFPRTLRPALDRMDGIAIRDGSAGSLEEIRLAVHLAKSAFLKKTNKARVLRYEFLLWLCGKNDIRSAIKESEPGEGEGFLVIVFSSIKRETACRMLLAEELPLALKKEADPLSLERISLSRIG